jgi:hypothetical protein
MRVAHNQGVFFVVHADDDGRRTCLGSAWNIPQRDLALMNADSANLINDALCETDHLDVSTSEPSALLMFDLTQA